MSGKNLEKKFLATTPTGHTIRFGNQKWIPWLCLKFLGLRTKLNSFLDLGPVGKPISSFSVSREKTKDQPGDTKGIQNGIFGSDICVDMLE